MNLHVHFVTIFVIIVIVLASGHALHVIFVIIVVTVVTVATLLATTVLLVRIVVITLHMLLLSLLVQCSGLLKAFLIDIILLVIDPTVRVVDLAAVLLLDHALALELLLAHLVKPVLFIVSVRHDPRNQLRVHLAQIHRIAIFVNHHARIVDIVLVIDAVIVVGIILAVAGAPPTELLLLVDFLSCCDGVLKVDGNFMLASIVVTI